MFKRKILFILVLLFLLLTGCGNKNINTNLSSLKENTGGNLSSENTGGNLSSMGKKNINNGTFSAKDIGTKVELVLGEKKINVSSYKKNMILDTIYSGDINGCNTLGKYISGSISKYCKQSIKRNMDILQNTKQCKFIKDNRLKNICYRLRYKGIDLCKKLGSNSCYEDQLLYIISKSNSVSVCDKLPNSLNKKCYKEYLLSNLDIVTSCDIYKKYKDIYTICIDSIFQKKIKNYSFLDCDKLDGDKKGLCKSNILYRDIHNYNIQDINKCSLLQYKSEEFLCKNILINIKLKKNNYKINVCNDYTGDIQFICKETYNNYWNTFISSGGKCNDVDIGYRKKCSKTIIGYKNIFKKDNINNAEGCIKYKDNEELAIKCLKEYATGANDDIIKDTIESYRLPATNNSGTTFKTFKDIPITKEELGTGGYIVTGEKLKKLLLDPNIIKNTGNALTVVTGNSLYSSGTIWTGNGTPPGVTVTHNDKEIKNNNEEIIKTYTGNALPDWIDIKNSKLEEINDSLYSSGTIWTGNGTPPGVTATNNDK